MTTAAASPLRTKIANDLRHWLRESAPPAHSVLPSHKDLCERFEVSLNTLRGALDLLEVDGMVYRRHRSGTFVGEGSHPQMAGFVGLRCINFVRDRPMPLVTMADDFLGGYTDALEPYDTKMRFVTVPEDGSRLDAILSTRYAPAEQGCILMNAVSPALMNWLIARRICFVVQNYGGYSFEGLPDHHRVFANKLGGTLVAVNHVLELGHRRVAFLGRISAGESDEQYHGYIAALRAAGIHPAPGDLMQILSNDVDVAMGPVTEFLKRPNRATAIFAKTHAVGMAVLQAAPSLGIRVPQDLSVIGYSGTPGGETTDPPLTTVEVPYRSVARTAVELLHGAARGEFDTPQTRMLECRLVVRGSTAPPGGAAG